MSILVEHHGKRTSDILVGLVENNREGDTHLQIGGLLKALGDRVYGILFMLFGLPNILPIPGLPVLCGLILAFLGYQLMLLKPTPWLPERLQNVRVAKSDFAKIITKAFPLITKLEAFSKPRLDWLASHESARFIGLVVLALAISLILIPVPFIGSISQGLAILFLGLGLVERDGLIVAIGYALALIAAAVITGITFALIFGAKWLF